jgi:hypothetical protein
MSLYDTFARRLDTVSGNRNRDQYWLKLRKVRAEYDAINEHFTLSGFRHYLIENYGIEIYYKDDNITEEFRIVNEQKYLVFNLKFE